MYIDSRNLRVTVTSTPTINALRYCVEDSTISGGRLYIEISNDSGRVGDDVACFVSREFADNQLQRKAGREISNLELYEISVRKIK